MTTCLTCQHWLPKDTDPGLARLGFAQCAKKKRHHCMSARAVSCEKYAAASQEDQGKRAAWIDKLGKAKRPS